MATKGYGVSWSVECRIGKDKVLIGNNDITHFEWKSMINGGFIVRIGATDANFQKLDKVIEASGALLETGRQVKELTLVEFKIKWDGTEELKETRTSLALISNLKAKGNNSLNGEFEFIAVDPISYFLNSGKSSGTAYKGKIGGEDGVIAQVFNDYVPKKVGGYTTKLKIAETDDEVNTYWMMRQDPKTFIMSLLDWSCSFTKHKSAWRVSSGQDEADKVLTLDINESYVPHLEWPAPSADPLVLNLVGGTTDIDKWELLTDNFLSALNLKLLTSGMSATSGEYFDKETDKEDEKKVYVKDENTRGKVNPELTAKQSFTKPTDPVDRGWTHIKAAPEIYSAGDIGFRYDRYIDGRARQMYMDMLGMLMRIRITAMGQHRLFDSVGLGRTKVKLSWVAPDKEKGGTTTRFLNGEWLLYGWHHKANRNGTWRTDLYLSRLDWDAASTGS